MRASKSHTAAPIPCASLPRSLPDIQLHHGEALWVLAQLGFQGAVTASTFREYIKSLRKLGTPFKNGKIGFGRKRRANYSYFHLMELALVLTLRVYHVVPDAILVKVVRHRTRLYDFYRRAYAERTSGAGAPVAVRARGHSAICLRGVFLDLQINFSDGKLVGFGPPKLLSPLSAAKAFAGRDVAARSLLPTNLSLLSERIVSTALSAPVIPTGAIRERAQRFPPSGSVNFTAHSSN
jgi:hypothetical protein